jgi:hypothetical protein
MQRPPCCDGGAFSQTQGVPPGPHPFTRLRRLRLCTMERMGQLHFTWEASLLWWKRLLR